MDSERAIQTTKRMIAAYVNENQDNWDINLPQFMYAYNSGVHGTTNCTPFETMFGRPPKLPIDLLYPQVPPNIRVEISSADQEADLAGIELLEDSPPKLCPDVTKTISILKKRLLNIGKVLRKNKDIKMDRAKLIHDRRIKKEIYEIGEYVLCSHPRIAKGQKRGIAAKYYGPFKITGINSNGCNYVIKSDTRGARAKQVHKNNLKAYHKRGIETPLPDSQTTPIIEKRTYRKDPNNPRWRQSSSLSSDEGDCSSSESDEQSENERQPEAEGHPVPIVSDNTDSSSSSSLQVNAAPIRAKRKYIKRTHQTLPVTTRSGRVAKRPDYTRL